MEIEHEKELRKNFGQLGKRRITFFLDDIEFRYYPKTRKLFKGKENGSNVEMIVENKKKEKVLRRLLRKQNEARKFILSYSL